MKTKFGLFGTGFWAEEVHAKSLSSNPSVELVGVWGRNTTSARRIAARFGIPVFESADELIEASSAVAIALSPDAQAPLAIRAAKAGRHLLMEKPLAFSTAEAVAIADAAESNRVANLVFLTHRFVPVVASWLERVRSQVWESSIGEWLSASTLVGSPFAGSQWRQQKGGLWDVGPHALSLAIRALGPISHLERAVNDKHSTTHIAFTHDSGAKTRISLGIEIPKDRGKRSFILSRGDQNSAMPDPGFEWVSSHSNATRQLLEMIEAQQSDHPCDARFNVEITRTLETAQKLLVERD